MIFTNIQYYQTLFLSSILAIGVFFFSLDISFLEIFITFFLLSLWDMLGKYLSAKEKTVSFYSYPASGVNAGFGICFFLRSEDIFIYIFAAILAIATKYIFQYRSRHFLNPSNAALCISLLLFPQYTWINTLQWWDYSSDHSLWYWVILWLVLFLWILMTQLVKRLQWISYMLSYSIPFIGLHMIFFYFLPYYESWSSFFLFFNISFFIFTFFMITDPHTVPKKAESRIYYAISLVISFYILQFFINESYALLFSLFCNTFLLPVIWFLEERGRTLHFLYMMYLCIIGSFLTLCVYYYGQPDLVFDNICNQLICK